MNERKLRSYQWVSINGRDYENRSTSHSSTFLLSRTHIHHVIFLLWTMTSWKSMCNPFVLYQYFSGIQSSRGEYDWDFYETSKWFMFTSIHEQHYEPGAPYEKWKVSNRYMMRRLPPFRSIQRKSRFLKGNGRSWRNSSILGSCRQVCGLSSMLSYT